MLRVKFVWKMFLLFRKHCRGMRQHELLDLSILPRFIHITITEGRGYEAEGRGKKQKRKKEEASAKKPVDSGGEMYCSKLFDLVQ